MQEMQVQSLEKGVTAHFSIPVWEVSWTEEQAGGGQGLQKSQT